MNEIYSMELQYESLIPIDCPKDTFLSIDFLAELFFSKEFAQALTINAATKPLILLHRAIQLGPNTFQLFS